MTAFSNQTVLVAGGSEGIGLSVARYASERGADVILLGRSRTKLDRALATLAGRHRGLCVDIADRQAVETALGQIEPLDHVYIAAGAFVPGSILDGDIDAYRRALDVRLWGSAYIVRVTAPRMRRNGSFVLTGGLATRRPHAGAWITSVATAATEQLARVLCLELATLGLRCNAISPGWTDTPMWDAILGEEKAVRFAAIQALVPTGRIASADEVAAVVGMLFTNAALNGETIAVDGGHQWA